MSLNVIVIPALAFMVCLLVHAVIWRVWYPKSRPAALFLIFVALPLTVGGLWAIFAFNGILPGPGFETGEWVAAALLQLALASAYILSYPAFEALSPSLVIVLLVGSSGGIRKEKLSGFFSDDDLLEPRIKDLAESGLATSSDSAIVITPKGRSLAGFFVFIRTFLGLRKGGG